MRSNLWAILPLGPFVSVANAQSSSSSEAPYLGGDNLPPSSIARYMDYSTVVSPNRNASTSSSSLAVSVLQAASITSTTNAPTATSTSATPTNTRPCNGHPEFCSRRYSNITYVAAHNSPFVRSNNAAANQELPVLDQLNDGIRMLQGQTHYNSTTKQLSYCHTSCDLLDAGPVQDYFRTVAGWVGTHPYDIVTILIGNADFVNVQNYTSPLEQSGLVQYAYVPPQIPMNISAWPTLEEMILSQKRVVVFMDYNANQTEVPYILDEFSQIWETPFSPTNRTFPCTTQRPPGIARAKAEQQMYMANHNLNTEITLAGASILVPTTSLMNETNAVSGFGSLGLMANDCAALWPQPPNFLLVDYYNQGNVPGSVFQVAAQHNNVTYTRPCCGSIPSGAARAVSHAGCVIAILVAAVTTLLVDST